ncbi:hypothetical protein SAMN05443636_2166 [Halobaculum gomorrense]|uniref:Uncharacterized protein n=1 Tax=Halobaculum gomorrense TaxID=43928 RepID=A0A1M5REK1_9EURY|nr:hypothetical protein SAMN05443636_2166 [Halobaculum gomorrense]
MSGKSKIVVLFGVVVLLYVLFSSNTEAVEVEVESED